MLHLLYSSLFTKYGRQKTIKQKTHTQKKYSNKEEAEEDTHVCLTLLSCVLCCIGSALC